MPHGVLFRGSEEGKFREELIAKRNILEAVIGLPSGLFYGTGIPAALLIINKAKKDDKILFINADGEYKEGKNQNLLRAEDIEKINFTYQKKLELTKYSRLVTLEEIQKDIESMAKFIDEPINKVYIQDYTVGQIRDLARKI